MRLFNAIAFIIELGVGVVFVLVLCLAIDVERAGMIVTPEPADAAIVLGAAVVYDRPSAVFAERLRFAVALYEAGTVQTIIVSGGLGPGDVKTEGDSGRDWIIARGVPASAVIAETAARTTNENLALSRPILKDRGIRTVLIVSDPLHMRRALTMAGVLGIDARPAPTPTSRIVSPRPRFQFLLREVWFSFWFALTGN